MAAMRLGQVQRFILTKKIFWGYGHVNTSTTSKLNVLLNGGGIVF